MFKTVFYELRAKAGSLSAPLRVAQVSDLHDRRGDAVVLALEALGPDIIAVSGDLMEDFRSDPGRRRPPKNTRAFDFLRKASAVAPVFYSLGNHERFMPDCFRAPIRETGAVLLDNAGAELSLPCGTVSVGGLSSRPDLDWLAEFSRRPGYKLLLCHHPEFYDRFISGSDIDLTLSGHAHGGQWRICGRGIYSPDQGLLPKYCGGLHHDRLIVSRGLANTAPVPRFGNPKELVIADIHPGK